MRGTGLPSHNHGQNSGASKINKTLTVALTAVPSSQQYTLLHTNNQLDIELYRHIVANMCQDLHALGLWSDAAVQHYWKLYAPVSVPACTD
jgi:hypothetical protein